MAIDGPTVIVSAPVTRESAATTSGSPSLARLVIVDEPWRERAHAFLTSVKQRGLRGVRLVISDQHAGLVKALRRFFQGAGHKRCRVQFARNLLAHMPKDKADMVASMFRMVSAQPDPLWSTRPGTRSATASPHRSRRSGH